MLMMTMIVVNNDIIWILTDMVLAHHPMQALAGVVTTIAYDFIVIAYNIMRADVVTAAIVR